MPTYRIRPTRVFRGSDRPLLALVLALLAGSGLESARAESAAAVPTVSVIPLPASVVSQPGAFRLTAHTRILVAPGDKGAAAAAGYLADLLLRSRHLRLPVRPLRAVPAPPAGAIVFARRDGLAAEAYALELAPAGATVAASTDAGLFYGAVTLFELMPAGAGPARVPALRIEDQPAFGWRGLMLDSARHYQSPAFIRRFIDGMALHKLNVLQWHLTDDQGWRLEIHRYPRLTEVGAYRVPAGRAALADIDPATHAPRRYGGFYSQATVRELIAYAASRHVSIVPEIDVPGHASAALAAYPELGVAPARREAVPADWGIYPDVYNVSEASCVFFENVLAEVVELFPGRYVHVGGDEVVADRWQQSPAMQARARELGLPDPTALHGYLVQRLGRFLAGRGRRLVGWDEIIEPGLSTEVTVMSWRGLDGALAAARRGNDTVLSPSATLYFDYRQSGAPDEPPGRVALETLRGVYEFGPVPAGLTAGEAVHVLGVQANVWTEHIRTEERVGHASFPRAAALAEVAWSPASRRDWQDFLGRLGAQFRAYRALGVPYSDSDFAVRATRDYDRAAGAVTVALATESGRGEIHYTLDGHEPGLRSPRYTKPLTLSTPRTLRAASFLGGERVAATRDFDLGTMDAQRRSSHALELCSNGIALALEVDAPATAPRDVVRLDIMNPCWIYRGVDLSVAATLVAAVGSIPFNYQIGAAASTIRVGDAVSPDGELEVRIDGCEGAPVVTLPLARAAQRLGVTVLPPALLPARAGAHDVCLRFARPALDPMWALDWVEIAKTTQ